MKTNSAIFNYRKCFTCGSTTKDMKQERCKCGGYMSIMGGVYVPRTIRSKNKLHKEAV